jgi:hypothetical protein
MDSIELQEVNKQISELQLRKAALVLKETQKDVDFIAGLTWLEGCSLRLEICGIYAYGLPRFKLHVLEPELPYTLNHINIYGTNKNSTYNIVYSNRDMYGTESKYMYTSCTKTLVEFLSKYKFKSVGYDKDVLEILLAARNANEKYIR